MSLEKQIKHNCPHCDIEQSLSIYNSVNVTIQPDLKSRVLSGKLNSQPCSNCKKDINIMSGFLYHDMENRVMINLKLDEGDDELSKSEILKNLKDQGYIYRNVNSYPELIEKIKLIDHKLNDSIIENIKSELTVMLSKSLNAVVGETDDSEINIFFDKIEKSLFKKKLSFLFFMHPSQIMSIDYDLKKLSKQDRQNLYDLDVLRN
jgi:hypothetical protein